MRRLFIMTLVFLFAMTPLLGNAQQTGSKEDDVPKQIEQPENPGFEEPFKEGDIPGWTISPDPLRDGTEVTLTDERSFSGSYSVRFDDRSTTASILMTSSSLSVEPGRKYAASVKTFITDGSDSPLLYIKFLDASGKTIQSTFERVGDPKKSWTTLTNKAIAPPEATQAIIQMYSGAALKGTIYFDDVTFEEIEQLENPSFEEPLFEGTIPGWTISPNPLRDGNDVTLTDERSFSGSYSVRFDDVSTTAPIGMTSSPLLVEPGKKYAASIKTFITDGSDSPNLYIQFMDASGRTIQSTFERVSDPTESWMTLSIEAIAPPEATQAKIQMYSGVAQEGTIYFDDVTFEKRSLPSMPYEYGEPVSLGDATLVAQTQGGAIGNGEIYFGTNGSPAVFYVLDALTGEVKFSEPLPGDDVIWASTIGSDGNVYISGTKTRILYRYNVEEKDLENLGQNPSNKFVWDLDASSDGKIYGSTYPDSKAFIYDIQAEAFTDLGTLMPGEDYVRGSGVTDQYFYAGIGTTAHLLRFDRETGERKEINLPITGTETSIANVWSYGGRLFIRYGTSLLVLNEETHEVLLQLDWQDENTFDGYISPPSPYNSDLIYFRNKNTSELWTYDIGKNEISAVAPQIKLSETPLRAIDWVKLKDGPNAGRHVLVMLSHEVDQIIFDPVDHSVTRKQPNVSKTGINIQSLEKGPDDNLYMGGYQGAMSVYDAVKGEFILQEKEPDQIEGIGFLNGKVYFGLYGGSLISAYDPSQPFEMGENPYTAYHIPDNQSRPFTFAAGEGKLFSGTISDYGHLGGALTVYDEATNEWNTYRNVVQNQSVMGLAYHEGKVYAGTTLWGGLGIEPSETEARMFEWDVASAKKTAEFKPNVPDFTIPKMIGELEMGPDGNLWGIMWGETETSNNAFALFAMNPATKQVVKSKTITNGDRGSFWRPFHLRWGDDGLLYTTIGRHLVVFDPDTLAYRKLIDRGLHSMTLGPDGSIYYGDRSELIKIPIRMKGAVLSASSTTMVVGEEMDMDVSLQLVNGKIGNAAGTEIAYTISDPSVAEVKNGQIRALKEGMTTISATVKQDKAVQTTNELQIDVEGITTSTILDTLDNSLEEISEEAYRALSLHLTAVGRYEQQEMVNKIVKHMHGFNMLLDHQKDEALISEKAYQRLGMEADLLIGQWRK